jgi:hypothetical protein
MRAAILLVLLTMPAFAQEQLHSQQYYEQNRGVRDVTLGWCHAEVSRARMWDCRNAEAANQSHRQRSADGPGILAGEPGGAGWCLAHLRSAEQSG